MVESTTHAEWIRRNVFDVAGCNIGLESIGKHLKRRRGECIETENVCDTEGLQYQWSRGDSLELEMHELVHQLEASHVS